MASRRRAACGPARVRGMPEINAEDVAAIHACASAAERDGRSVRKGLVMPPEDWRECLSDHQAALVSLAERLGWAPKLGRVFGKAAEAAR